MGPVHRSYLISQQVFSIMKKVLWSACIYLTKRANKHIMCFCFFLSLTWDIQTTCSFFSFIVTAVKLNTKQITELTKHALNSTASSHLLRSLFPCIFMVCEDNKEQRLSQACETPKTADAKCYENKMVIRSSGILFYHNFNTLPKPNPFGSIISSVFVQLNCFIYKSVWIFISPQPVLPVQAASLKSSKWHILWYFLHNYYENSLAKYFVQKNMS